MALRASTVEGPLNGVIVVDLTRVLAGPFCTMSLADLGARVIKVEAPERGDDARQYGPFRNGKSAYFMSLNRGKESIALNLKDPAGREVFEALLADADVLIENFRPGAMERLGYGWRELHRSYPRLIYAAASGFGQNGPYAQRAAYDVVIQGMGGVMSMTGHRGMPPARVGTSVGDISAGLFAAIGINAALYHRRTSGEGVMLDISMLDCQVAICENAIARYLATGKIPGPEGARNPSITPFESYATKDDYVIIAAGNDVLFERLVESLGRPQLASDQRFLTNTSRTANAEALKHEFELTLREHTTAHWLIELEKAGVPCGPINNIKQVVEDPQVITRNMLVAIDDPEAGECRTAGNPIKMSAFPDPPTRAPMPDLDQHRDGIIKELQISHTKD